MNIDDYFDDIPADRCERYAFLKCLWQQRRGVVQDARRHYGEYEVGLEISINIAIQEAIAELVIEDEQAWRAWVNAVRSA